MSTHTWHPRNLSCNTVKLQVKKILQKEDLDHRITNYIIFVKYFRNSTIEVDPEKIFKKWDSDYATSSEDSYEYSDDDEDDFYQSTGIFLY